MAFSEDMLESLKNFDTDQLSDLNQVGSWPVAVKVIIWSLVFMGALGAGYFFHVTNLQAELTKLQISEMNIRTEYEKKNI